jgi:hypothetical protein
MSFGCYQVEIAGKIVSEWIRLDEAVAAALDEGVEKALKRGAIPGFKVFYVTAVMRHGKKVRHLMFTGVAGPIGGPAALTRPGPDQQRTHA